MSEKLDLDDLLLAIRTGKADAVFVHDTVVAMWKRIESLESASNAGGAVAWAYECRQPFTENPVRWAEFFSRKKPDDNKEWIRNVTPLYTHPAPASKEPVADERMSDEHFTALWRLARMVDAGYWIGQARAALATAQTGENRDAFNEWFAAKIANGMTPEEIAFGMHVNNIAVCKEREEVETLRAVAKEYDALIRHMDAGGDFHAFHAAMLPAAPAKPEGV